MELKHRKNLIRILAKGGVLTPQYLLDILSVARKSGNQHIHFGSRQDIIFKTPRVLSPEVIDDLARLNIEYIAPEKNKTNYQNIVSSYAASDLVPATQWLNSGNYLKILEDFTEPHRLRINIADTKQSLVPLFYGNLNFVTSAIKNYWFRF